jgi:thiosulfate/3-mercaptopyruvate sulfurtransferase
MEEVEMRRSSYLNLAAVAVLIAGLMLAGPAIAGEKCKGFERADSLISPEGLKTLMDAKDPKLVLIGVVKGGLTGSYAMGHIPGSYGVWRSDYTAAKGDEYPFGGMRMNQAAFQAFARSLGVDDDSKVVIYDEKYDATRLWWMFYLYGKTDVQILDGGYEAWKLAEYDTEMGGGLDKGTKEGTFTAKPATEGMVWEMDKIKQAEKDDSIQLWDTREPDEWSGAKLKKGASRQGRVPWAKFLSWKEFRNKVNDKTPTEFKNAEEIAKVIEANGIDKNKDQVFYCQSGVRTTTHIFSLYLLGWDMAKLHNYDGSWIEWSYHEDNPLVVDE